MLVVVSLTDSPPKVRGDLSLWLMEISTGVYVGRISERVRAKLWKRICENLHEGRATMIWSSNCEQHLRFAVHNTTWEPVDFDGLTLMLHPSEQHLNQKRAQAQPQTVKPAKLCKAEKILLSRRHSNHTFPELHTYTVIDVETTGLSPQKHELIEVAALRIVADQPQDKYTTLIRTRKDIPDNIIELTGITPEMIKQEGCSLKEALQRLSDFIGDTPIVGHNVNFDYRFLKASYERCHLPPISQPKLDTMTMARKLVTSVINHRLGTLARHFGFDARGAHRALADCYLTYKLLLELQKKR